MWKCLIENGGLESCNADQSTVSECKLFGVLGIARLAGHQSHLYRFQVLSLASGHVEHRFVGAAKVHCAAILKQAEFHQQSRDQYQESWCGRRAVPLPRRPSG